MQVSLYAFVPLAILAVIALIAACIALWPGRRDLAVATPPARTRRSAEILPFPSRPSQNSATATARLRQGSS